MSIHTEMLDIREYDNANVAQGLSISDRILLLNKVFDEWIFTPDATWNKILAVRSEDVRCTQVEV